MTALFFNTTQLLEGNEHARYLVIRGDHKVYDSRETEVFRYLEDIDAEVISTRTFRREWRLVVISSWPGAKSVTVYRRRRKLEWEIEPGCCAGHDALATCIWWINEHECQ